MREDFLRQILKDVKDGKVSEDAAFEQLKELPYKDLGFANLDYHRQTRTGFPEVVYCAGKTPAQIADIFAALSEHGTVMGTRATENDFAAVKEKLPEAEKIEIAGPGFINFWIKKDALADIINVILTEKDDYGKSDFGKGVKYLEEYVSANPTGPLHCGHARGAVWGDSCVRILNAAGFNATREYYINDAGAQIHNLGLCQNTRNLRSGLHPAGRRLSWRRRQAHRQRDRRQRRRQVAEDGPRRSR